MSMVYFDNQATTKIDPKVAEKMLPYLDHKYGNPHSSEYQLGWDAHKELVDAQSIVADFIEALPEEVVFTSGATEANNQAIKGIAYAALAGQSRRRTILVSSIEHKCILGAARSMEAFGFVVRKIPVQSDGRINKEAFIDLLDEDVLLVSTMACNNEIGVTQDISFLGNLAKNNGSIFHVDAAQAGYMKIDITESCIDLLSLSAHKIYGPQGVGALIVSNDSTIKPMPLLSGGNQQNGLRAGTVPVPLAVGFSEACKVMKHNRIIESVRISKLRDRLLKGICEIDTRIYVNGSLKYRHPGNLNLCLPNINAQIFIMGMHPHIAFSSGAACTSGIVEVSHVLKAIGLSTQEADCSFRMCVGRFNSDNDIDFALNHIRKKYSSMQL